MGVTAHVRGTGHKNTDGSSRRRIIRRFVREDILITLFREPHDRSTVAVYVSAPKLFGLLGASLKQIGYIDETSSRRIAKLLDARGSLSERVAYLFAPSWKQQPRVGLKL